MIVTDELRDALMGDLDHDTVQRLHDRFLTQYGEPQHGSSRLTYLVDETLVVKLPRGPYDVVSQYNEVAFAEEHPEVPVAKNWMEIIDGVPVVWMERVTPWDWSDRRTLYEVHPWSTLRDGPQCGYTADGVLVCFDLGYEYY
jgi:hypothetical protein